MMRPTTHFIIIILFLITTSLGFADAQGFMTVKNAREFVISFLTGSGGSSADNFTKASDDVLLAAFFSKLEKSPGKTILFTDIDDTLLEAKYIFTTSKYFKFKIPQRRKELRSQFPDLSDDEIEKIIDDEFWKYVTQFKDVQVLDPFYLRIIHGLQERGHLTLALTARPENLLPDTQDQFKQVGLVLGKNLPNTMKVHHPGVLFSPKSGKKSTKGQMLFNFMLSLKENTSSDQQFSNLFFFDDNQPDIDAVVESIKANAEHFEDLHSVVVKTMAAEYFSQERNYEQNLERIGDIQLADYLKTGKNLSNEEALQQAQTQSHHAPLLPSPRKTDYDFLTSRSIFGFSDRSNDQQLISQARKLVGVSDPSRLAEAISIGENYKLILQWMEKDLQNYLENFDHLFQAKLDRIKAHEDQRRIDMETWLKPMLEKLQQNPKDQLLNEEIGRLTNELKPHGFTQEYLDANDFINKFVGEKGKILKMAPSVQDIEKMNRPGKKTLYVDTWAVPFFNTGTQSKEEAKEGVKKSLKAFKETNYTQDISFRQFTELAAMFARPEFDDVRRYKMKLFPSAQNQTQFKNERSDALIAGRHFPEETFIFVIDEVGLDPLSYTFGLRTHALGFISHTVGNALADGRIFTGPADFMEHDYSHAFFNLSGLIPGTPLDWQRIHEEFFDLKAREPDPALRRMMSLVYFHLTHESGFKTLMPDHDGTSIDPNAYSNLITDIREKTRIRFYYDWLVESPTFKGKFDDYLELGFAKVSPFFKERISGLLQRRSISNGVEKRSSIESCRKSLQ